MIRSFFENNNADNMMDRTLFYKDKTRQRIDIIHRAIPEIYEKGKICNFVYFFCYSKCNSNTGKKYMAQGITRTFTLPMCITRPLHHSTLLIRSSLVYLGRKGYRVPSANKCFVSGRKKVRNEEYKYKEETLRCCYKAYVNISIIRVHAISAKPD